MGEVTGNSFRVRRRPLAYASALQRRERDAIDLVVIHCTELPDLAMAREYGERVLYDDTGTGNSGHYYVDRNGAVEEWVPPEHVAHHTRGFNQRSIGIELVNSGRYPHWFDSRHQQMTEPYPRAQVTRLIRLLQNLAADLPTLAWIAGHECLDTGVVAASDKPEVMVQRKRDPGPLFPWDSVMASMRLTRLQGPPP